MRWISSAATLSTLRPPEKSPGTLTRTRTRHVCRQASKLAAFPDPDGRGHFDANHVESGGGGLVPTTHDYARFCQMLLNKGELDGERVLQPESVDLMAQNHIGALRLFSDGTRPNSGLPGAGFGLDFAVVTNPAATNSKQGEGSHDWSGIVGTWFWIDPRNDLVLHRHDPAPRRRGRERGELPGGFDAAGV